MDKRYELRGLEFTGSDFDNAITDQELENLPFHSGHKSVRSQTDVFAEFVNKVLAEKLAVREEAYAFASKCRKAAEDDREAKLTAAEARVEKLERAYGVLKGRLEFAQDDFGYNEDAIAEAEEILKQP